MQRIAIVTDGLWRKSLSAVRCLGKSGERVLVQGEGRLTPSYYSAWVTGHRSIPSSEKLPTQFDAQMRAWIAELPVRPVLLPMEEASLRWAQGLPPGLVDALLPDQAAWQRAASKLETARLAQEVGVSTPEVYWCQSSTELLSAWERACEEGGKWVLKPVMGKGSNGIIYPGANSKTSRSKIENLFRDHGAYLLQRRIPSTGRGVGASFLYDQRGLCIAQFAHTRLHEYPISGGPSTDRQAADVEDALPALTAGRKLLDRLQWKGVAMVEFKRNPETGELSLLEINPRFWGSLELAVRARVEFPVLYTRAARGEEFSELPSDRVGYKPRVRVRWTIPGELLRYLATPAPKRESLVDFFRGFVRLSEEWDPTDRRAYAATWIVSLLLALNPRYWRFLKRG